MRKLGLKVLAEAPNLLGSLVVWSLASAPLPNWTQAATLAAGLLTVALSRSRAWERLLAGLRFGARRPTPAEQDALAEPITRLCAQRLGPPAVEVQVVQHPGWGVGAFGRRTLLVIVALRRGTLTPDEATALMIAAVGVLRSGPVGWDAAICALTLPVLPIRALFAGMRQGMTRLPLVWFAWQARAVVIGIAVWQQATTGQPALAGALALVGAVSYLAPVAGRRLGNHIILVGDQFAAETGHQQGLARFLRRFPDSDLAAERLHHLAPPAPRLSVVR